MGVAYIYLHLLIWEGLLTEMHVALGLAVWQSAVPHNPVHVCGFVDGLSKKTPEELGCVVDYTLITFVMRQIRLKLRKMVGFSPFFLGDCIAFKTSPRIERCQRGQAAINQCQTCRENSPPCSKKGKCSRFLVRSPM